MRTARLRRWRSCSTRGGERATPAEPSPSSRGRGWLLVLVASAVITQAGLNLVRPVTSYKLLALGADSTTVGLVTAGYAVLPLVVALSLPRLVDRRADVLRLMAAAALVLLGGAGLVATATGVWLLAVGTVVLGLGVEQGVRRPPQ